MPCNASVTLDLLIRTPGNEQRRIPAPFVLVIKKFGLSSTLSGKRRAVLGLRDRAGSAFEQRPGSLPHHNAWCTVGTLEEAGGQG